MTDKVLKSPIEDVPIAELRDLASTMHMLMQTPGFLWWKSVVTAQKETRMASMFQPIKQEDVLEQEFRKGEMQSLEFSLSLWSLLLEQVQEEITSRSTPEDEGREK